MNVIQHPGKVGLRNIVLC